jgi:hypothetical protein
LEEKGYPLRVFDPLIPARSTVPDLAAALAQGPVVMLATNHDAFVRQLTPAALKRAGVRLVIDGKNALNADAIAAAGIHYYGIGRLTLHPEGEAYRAYLALSGDPLRSDADEEAAAALRAQLQAAGMDPIPAPVPRDPA